MSSGSSAKALSFVYNAQCVSQLFYSIKPLSPGSPPLPAGLLLNFYSVLKCLSQGGDVGQLITTYL
jgi:hypothetical protein